MKKHLRAPPYKWRSLEPPSSKDTPVQFWPGRRQRGPGRTAPPARGPACGYVRYVAGDRLCEPSPWFPWWWGRPRGVRPRGSCPVGFPCPAPPTPFPARPRDTTRGLGAAGVVGPGSPASRRTTDSGPEPWGSGPLPLGDQLIQPRVTWRGRACWLPRRPRWRRRSRHQQGSRPQGREPARCRTSPSPRAEWPSRSGRRHGSCQQRPAR